MQVYCVTCVAQRLLHNMTTMSRVKHKLGILSSEQNQVSAVALFFRFLAAKAPGGKMIHKEKDRGRQISFLDQDIALLTGFADAGTLKLGGKERTKIIPFRL